MNKEDFVKAMKYLATAYNRELNEEQVSVWYSFLKDTKKEVLKKVLQNIIAKNKHFPSIAEVREEIALLQTKDIPKAEDEWEKVIEAVRKYGSYRQEEALESLKPYTAYITRHIGFSNICMATDQTWNKKEFIGEYNQLKDKEIENIQIGNTSELFLLGDGTDDR